MMLKGPINSVVDPTVVALAIRGGNAFISGGDIQIQRLSFV